MTDQESLAMFKEMLLAMNRIQESVSAVALALKERGLLERTEYESACQRVYEMNRERRERIEKLESLDPMIELLRGFQGPLQ